MVKMQKNLLPAGPEARRLLSDDGGHAEEEEEEEEVSTGFTSSSSLSSTFISHVGLSMEEDNPRSLEEGTRQRKISEAPACSIARPHAKTSSSDPWNASSSQSVATIMNPNKRGDKTVQVVVNPHPGDVYFPGNIYHKRKDDSETNKYGQDSRLLPNLALGGLTLNPLRRDEPYLRYIKSLAQQWPRLKYLAEFMNSGTVPQRALVLSPLEIIERQTKVKVAWVDFTNPENIIQETCESRVELSAIISRTSQAANEKLRRLFIVEDLSKTIIEMLGAALDIDPSFFRCHLEDHTWYNIKDDWVEMPELESQAYNRSFITLRYMQARFFEDVTHSRAAKEHASKWNVMRRLDFQGQVKSGKNAWWEASPHQVGLLRRKVSIWSANTEKGWLGVILVDPPVNAGHPLWNGYGSLEHPPSMADAELAYIRHSDIPVFDALLARISSLSAHERHSINSDPEQITSVVYPHIFAEVLVTLQYTFTGLFQIEWQLDSERTRKLEDLETALDSLHKWQRRLPFYVSWVRDSIVALEGKYSLWQQTPALSPFATVKPGEPLLRYDSTSTAETATMWRAGIRRDFVSLLARLQTLQLRADKIMKMAVAIISVEESKKAMLESRNMSRITYLAFIFVPMSFVSSFLSMNQDITSRSAMVYWVFFTVATPLSVGAVGLAVYWNDIVTWWEKKRKADKK
ncbi:hypothetical protein AAE478_005292 [Parahypoxylon ruwenzoriense]